MVICLERCVDLHMAQLMPLPFTVSCSYKIQIGFTFLVPAHLGSPGQRAVKRVCVCVLYLSKFYLIDLISKMREVPVCIFYVSQNAITHQHLAYIYGRASKCDHLISVGAFVTSRQ